MILSGIREALADRVSDVPGCRGIPYPPDSIPTGNAVAVTVTPDSTYVDYHRAFVGGLAYVNLTVTVWVPAADMRSAMNRLDVLLSSGSEADAGSLIDTLMSVDRSLGGLIDDLVVDNATNVRAEMLADGVRYLCADLSLRIMVRRT